MRALPLHAAGDPGHDLGHGLADKLGLAQEQRLDLAADRAQGVLDVAPQRRRAGGVVVEVLLAAIGKQAGQGDQGEGGISTLP